MFFNDKWMRRFLSYLPRKIILKQILKLSFEMNFQYVIYTIILVLPDLYFVEYGNGIVA